MDFTNPFTGLTPGRKLTTEEVLRALRIDLAAELDAINLYQAHIDAIDDQRVKHLIAHVRDEEKEHVAEFMAMINALDPTQNKMFSSEQAAAIEQGQDVAVVGDGLLGEEMSEPRPASDLEFTVGSLLGEEQS